MVEARPPQVLLRWWDVTKRSHETQRRGKLTSFRLIGPSSTSDNKVDLRASWSCLLVAHALTSGYIVSVAEVIPGTTFDLVM